MVNKLSCRDKGAPEQVITVERLALPPREERVRASQTFDVMEIQYVAQVQGSADVVDSSAEKSPPGLEHHLGLFSILTSTLIMTECRFFDQEYILYSW